MQLVDEVRNEVMKLNNKEAYIFIFSLLKRQLKKITTLRFEKGHNRL